MNPVYHFPDAVTLKNSIEANRAMIDRHFDKNNPYLCQIEELAAIHLAGQDKTEEEVSKLVTSFFMMPTVDRSKTLSLTNLITYHAIDDDLVNRIKTTLIECARFPKVGPSEDPTSVAAIRLSRKCDPSMSDLYIAAQYGFTEETKEIIRQQPDSIHSKTSFGTSILQIACFLGHLEIVNLLLDAGADIQHCDNNKAKALDAAIQARLTCDLTHVKIVKALLQKGKDLGLTIEQISNSSPLYEACKLAKVSIVSLLLEYGVELEKQGYPSLKWAVQMGFNNIVKLLLDNKIPVDPPTKKEQSALYEATFCGRLDEFLTLLESGANVNLQDDGGVSPLHVAALKGNMRFVEILAKRGADVNIEDANGYTPTGYALSEGHKDVAAKLKALGARK